MLHGLQEKENEKLTFTGKSWQTITGRQIVSIHLSHILSVLICLNSFSDTIFCSPWLVAIDFEIKASPEFLFSFSYLYQLAPCIRHSILTWMIRLLLLGVLSPNLVYFLSCAQCGLLLLNFFLDLSAGPSNYSYLPVFAKKFSCLLILYADFTSHGPRNSNFLSVSPCARL